MDGPIQNVFPNVLNGWPHTECFSKCIKWMAPYRMFSKHAKWMAPSQNGLPNILNRWPHTVMFFQTY